MYSTAKQVRAQYKNNLKHFERYFSIVITKYQKYEIGDPKGIFDADHMNPVGVKLITRQLTLIK